MRGVPIDMSAIAARNPTKPALGNANMNARGDLLGANGIVLKTQEQIEADWAAERARQESMSRPTDLKAPIEMIVPGAPKPQKKMLDVDDANFDPSKPASPSNIPPASFTPPKPASNTNRRKIVDSE